LQIIYGGKAHPRDEGGKAVSGASLKLSRMKDTIPLVYLENYDMTLVTTFAPEWICG
jgi:starch phosphorylase